MITWLIVTPLLTALFIAIAPKRLARAVAVVATTASLLLSLVIWRSFDPTIASLQLVERYPWIPSIKAEYLVGIDGLSLLLLLLTSLVVPFGILAERHDRAFYALMLVMQSALYGVFTAQNFVLWFLFYEMSLIPSFLLIKIWGGEKRDFAATKFFVYTFVGSIAMLLGFLAIYLARGSFDFATLTSFAKTGLLTGNVRWLAFAGIFLGLAVKVPLYPFHTWLPDAYEAAPTGVTMVLTGTLSKMGVYGFIRLLLPLFPSELRITGPWLLALAVCSIVLGALAAWAQCDLKRMAGYLSISHLGYCLLGVFAVAAATTRPTIDAQAALSGVFLQLFNHGLTAAALFYYIGLLEQRCGTRDLRQFGGLMQRTPIFCGWMAVTMFSSLGLPGLNGFVSEFLIFKGSFTMAATFTAVAALGLLFVAVALLRAMQAIFSGPLPATSSAVPDLLLHEKLLVVPVTLLMLGIGIAPQFLLTIFNTTVAQLAALLA